MFATTLKQRVLRIVLFCLAMLPGLAMPATDFECSGEQTLIFNGSQHDLAVGRACVVKLSTSTASLSVTGLAGGAPGRIIVLENSGSVAFSLTDASSNSTVGNRFQFPASLTVSPATSVFLRYDAGTAEWKAVAAPFSDDLALSDDLTVGDDLAVTGDLTVTAATALNGTTTIADVVSPLVLDPAAVRVYFGTKTLTEAGAAEALFTLTTATTQATGGILVFTARATDATDYVERTHRPVYFVCGNLGGTVQVAISDSDETNSVVGTTNAKTLTYAIANTAGANTCAVSLDIDSDMTVSAATADWLLILLGPGTIS